MKKYFDIFELDESASIEELDRAYTELSKACRPENYQNFPRQRREAESKLQEINEAYEALKSYMSAAPLPTAHHNQPESPQIEPRAGSFSDRLSEPDEKPDLDREGDRPPWERERPAQPANVISRSHIQKGVQKSLIFGLVAILAVLVVLLLYRLF